jgi:hypothetical protein
MSCATAALPAFFVSALGQLDAKYVDMLNNAIFVCHIREYLVDEMLIKKYRDLVASQLGTALTYLSTTIMTVWVAYQGFMIISGANRQPLLALVLKTAKMVFILSLVALIAKKSPEVANAVLGFQALITAAIVGEGTDIYRTIDLNLALSVVFNAVVDGLVGGQQAGAEGKSMTTMAGVIGQSGPAMVVSAYALAAEIFITLAIMLSPVFIFFLLFQQTAGKFWTWARYLLGTMFSLAVLVLVSSILLKMMMAYGASVIAAYYLNASALGSVISFDIAGSAMRMGMMGALSTALLVMIPPVIMGFFNSGASFAANALASAVGGGAGAAGVMQALQKGGSEGSAGANGATGAAGNNALGHSGDGSLSGSAAFNRQISQSIASRGMHAGGGEGALGMGGGMGGARALNAGSRGQAAGEAAGTPGLQAVQQRQQAAGTAGELRENPVTGIYETAGTAQSLRNDPQLGSGGHLNVASDSPAQRSEGPQGSPTGSVGGGTVARDANAAVVRTENHASNNAGAVQGAGWQPSQTAAHHVPVSSGSAASSSPVHAMPPSGAPSHAARAEATGMAGRDLRNPSAPRPSMPDRGNVERNR